MEISNNELVRFFIQCSENSGHIIDKEEEVNNQLEQEKEDLVAQRLSLYQQYLEEIDNKISSINKKLNDNRYMCALLGKYMSIVYKNSRETLTYFGKVSKVESPIQNKMVVYCSIHINITLKDCYYYNGDEFKHLDERLFPFEIDNQEKFTQNCVVRFLTDNEYQENLRKYHSIENAEKLKQVKALIEEKSKKFVNLVKEVYNGIKYYSTNTSVELCEEENENE